VSDNLHRRRLGQWGESVAATHLEAQGYRVVERNWRCSLGEIDIVAQDGEVLVFVEVKTRQSINFGLPEESITPRKAQRLIDLGVQYCADHALDDVEWRIDLVAIEIDNHGILQRCEHIPNAILGW
jgi:putative endonuclease